MTSAVSEKGSSEQKAWSNADDGKAFREGLSVHVYFFFVLFNFLFVCLFVFFYRDKQNIFLKSNASLIPADTRLSSLKRKNKLFLD